MKNKKALTYFLSGIIPVIIFFIAAEINGIIPLGDEGINIYDSFTQYPGFLLETIRLLKHGHLFYSFGAGLGFNMLGTITYYCMSPLNIFAIFATPTNYPYFVLFMTLLRFFLLGETMCFYLRSKKISNKLVVLFSVIYALMGYTATYYYNYIWIDSIIMLPLVVYGIDKLIETNKPLVYIITLTITITTNYYIGYMICIFSLIYYIYNLLIKKASKKTILTFIISSLLVGLMSTVIILPSYYALKIGKASLYENITYSGFNDNYKSFFYMFMPGNYKMGDQGYGPCQVYMSLLVVVLIIQYFLSKKISTREKIVTLSIIVFYYLSFSLRILNYAWQFFQQPIWWQSRFSFTFAFFLIALVAKNAEDLMGQDESIAKKVLIIGIFTLVVSASAYFKYEGKLADLPVYYFLYFILGCIIFSELLFLMGDHKIFKLIVVITFLDLSINCYNSIKNNTNYKDLSQSTYIREELPLELEKLNERNEYFYRFEFMDDYSSDDGPYFGYNGVNYFNSARNINVVYMMEKFGLHTADHCHFKIDDMDPALFSILNVKYVYGNKMDYFDEVDKNIYENPYPLSVGYTVDDKVKDFEFPVDQASGTNYQININALLNSMTGQSFDLYKRFDYTNFNLVNASYVNSSNNIVKTEADMPATAEYSFVSDGHYLIVPNISINLFNKKPGDEDKTLIRDYYYEINEGEEVNLSYDLNQITDPDTIRLILFDIDEYEKAMKILGENVLEAKTYQNGHIFEGNINIDKKHDYLFLTLGYEEGMKIYVDGKEVKPDKVLDAVIGLKLSKGKHNIYIDYVPKGLNLGIIVSSIGLLLTILYLQIHKKKL